MTSRYYDINTRLDANEWLDVQGLEGDEATNQLILNLMSTRRGERVRRPTVGCAIEDLLFDPIDEDTAHSIRLEIDDLFYNQISRAPLKEVIVQPVVTEAVAGYAVVILYGNNEELNPLQLSQLSLFLRYRGS